MLHVNLTMFASHVFHFMRSTVHVTRELWCDLDPLTKTHQSSALDPKTPWKNEGVFKNIWVESQPFKHEGKGTWVCMLHGGIRHVRFLMDHPSFLRRSIPLDELVKTTSFFLQSSGDNGIVGEFLLP